MPCYLNFLFSYTAAKPNAPVREVVEQFDLIAQGKHEELNEISKKIIAQEAKEAI